MKKSLFPLGCWEKHESKIGWGGKKSEIWQGCEIWIFSGYYWDFKVLCNIFKSLINLLKIVFIPDKKNIKIS